MKNTLLLIAAILFSLNLNAQIQEGQTSDFEDGTTQGWSNGGSSPNPPTNIPTGGPNGADDNFLEEISSGNSGAGGKMLIQNDNPEWTGSYTAAGITNIEFNVKNAGASDLFIRIAMRGGPNSSRMATSNSFQVPTSQTTWTASSLDIQPGSFQIVSGPDTVEEILADVQVIRIISNQNISYNGEQIAGTMHMDNITAIAALGINDTDQTDVRLYPNPVRDLLQVSANVTLDSYEIYNVLGSLVIRSDINDFSTEIDVSNLRSGVYMIRLNSAEGSQTKRFVKSN